MSGNRLFQMVYMLLDKKSITAVELAKHFEVSKRTIYRDIDILSAAGIPVYATQGKGGGISIQDNFVLNKSLLSEKEQEQILMALQGINIIQTEKANELLSKLGGVFKKQNISWIEVDFSDWTQNSADNNVFEILKKAIFDNHVATFTYYNSRGETSERLVEPLKLLFKSKDWYLYGYCRKRSDYRFFKLTRMRNVQVSTEEFHRSAPTTLLQAINSIEDTLLVTLKFEPSMAFRIFDEFPDKVVQSEDDGFLVNIQLPNSERLYSYLLSFGDGVKVVAPEEVRNEMLNRIKKMENKYIT